MNESSDGRRWVWWRWAAVGAGGVTALLVAGVVWEDRHKAADPLKSRTPTTQPVEMGVVPLPVAPLPSPPPIPIPNSPANPPDAVLLPPATYPAVQRV